MSSNDPEEEDSPGRRALDFVFDRGNLNNNNNNGKNEGHTSNTGLFFFSFRLFIRGKFSRGENSLTNALTAAKIFSDESNRCTLSPRITSSGKDFIMLKNGGQATNACMMAFTKHQLLRLLNPRGFKDCDL